MSQSDMMADARSYLSARLGGVVDFSTYDDDTVRGCIDTSYPGGWSAFQVDFTRSMREVQRKLTTPHEDLSPVKQKAVVQHFLGRKLKDHDTIVSLTRTDTEVKFVLSVAKVDIRSRRDHITSRELQLHVFSRPDTESPWSHQEIGTSTEVDEQYVRFGSVNSPERDESTREQVETCYRPGSSKTPMQGWIARAELSHKQAHADEIFQKPSAS